MVFCGGPAARIADLGLMKRRILIFDDEPEESSKEQKQGRNEVMATLWSVWVTVITLGMIFWYFSHTDLVFKR